MFSIVPYVRERKNPMRAMSARNELHSDARMSLASVWLTAAAITVNHFYVLGWGALLLGGALTVLPTGFLLWFRRTRSRVAFAAYMAMSLWIVVGFGLMKGLWKTTLRLFLGTALASVSTSFPRPAIGTPGFELSGVVTFIGSLFVLYFGYRLAGARYGFRANTVALATGSAVAALALVGAWVAKDRDRWTAPVGGVVKIGVIVPTDGPYAVLGNSFLKAVEMARNDLKGTRYRYELVVANSGPDPARAKDIVRRVVAEEKVDAVVGGISLIGQVTQPYAREARIAHLCVCTVASIGDGAYSFTNIPSPEAEGVEWVREARRRGIRTIAVLAQDYPSINNHVRAMKAEAERAGLSVSYERRFGAAATDFRAQISEAQASRADVFYVEALNPALDVLAQQLSDAGVRNVSSVVAPSLSARRDLFEGAWYTDSNLRHIEFKQRFEDKYPGTQFATHMMPYAYDSLNMIVQAFERGQNPAVYLRGLGTYDGTADTLTKERGSGHFRSAPAVWVIRDGKPVLIGGRS
jgi:ABC-type branched-subunit amino acid transport system substrate-binding protein